MTEPTEKAAAFIDRIIQDIGRLPPDRITCGWNEALDELLKEAFEKGRQSVFAEEAFDDACD